MIQVGLEPMTYHKWANTLTTKPLLFDESIALFCVLNNVI